MDSIQDAHDKGLISFHKEDLIVELLKNPKNWDKMTLALANTVPYRRFSKLDLLDFYIMYQERNN